MWRSDRAVHASLGEGGIELSAVNAMCGTLGCRHRLSRDNNLARPIVEPKYRCLGPTHRSSNARHENVVAYPIVASARPVRGHVVDLPRPLTVRTPNQGRIHL